MAARKSTAARRTTRKDLAGFAAALTDGVPPNEIDAYVESLQVLAKLRRETREHAAIRSTAESGMARKREKRAFVSSLLVLARHRQATRLALGMPVTCERSRSHAERIVAAARAARSVKR